MNSATDGEAWTWDFWKWVYIAMMKTKTMSETVEDWRRKATESARDAGQAADKYVRENAWASIVFAAVAGCVIGFLLARRRD